MLRKMYYKLKIGLIRVQELFIRRGRFSCGGAGLKIEIYAIDLKCGAARFGAR